MDSKKGFFNYSLQRIAPVFINTFACMLVSELPATQEKRKRLAHARELWKAFEGSRFLASEKV